MGMYTYIRGYVNLKEVDYTEEKFDKITKVLFENYPRLINVVFFKNGGNLENFIFLGGGIKNYFSQYENLFNLLYHQFNIEYYHIEWRYEETDEWSKVELENFAELRSE